MNLWARFRAWLDMEAEFAGVHDFSVPETRRVQRTSKARMDDVAARLTFAREEMRRRGTRTLLDGRATWQRINPMHVETSVSKVVKMRGRK